MISKDLQEYLSFQATIRDSDPDASRAARLALSDWLEERGLDDEAQEQRRLASDLEQSWVWIRSFSDRVGLTCEDLMDGAAEWLAHGAYLTRGGLLEEEYVPDEFWTHYQVVTRQVVPPGRQGSFFSCAC